MTDNIINKQNNSMKQPANNVIINNVKLSFFEDALFKIKKEIVNDQIGFDNIVITIIKLIEIVEKYKSLNGLEKKILVIKVISKHIEISNLSEDDKSNMIYIIDNTGSQIIDTIIFTSKGKLFKSIKRRLFKIFSCCK
jgi:predicted transcriptional regulator